MTEIHGGESSERECHWVAASAADNSATPRSQQQQQHLLLRGYYNNDIRRGIRTLHPTASFDAVVSGVATTARPSGNSLLCTA